MSTAHVDDSAFQADLARRIEELKAAVFSEVRSAAQEVRNEAINRTPVDTGLLRAAWQVHETASTGALTVVVENTTKYAPAVEYGTRAHLIQAQNASVLADKKTGKVFGKTVNHPGTKPRPMLRPAVSTVVPRLTNRLKGL